MESRLHPHPHLETLPPHNPNLPRHRLPIPQGLYPRELRPSAICVKTGHSGPRTPQKTPTKTLRHAHPRRRLRSLPIPALWQTPRSLSNAMTERRGRHRSQTKISSAVSAVLGERSETRLAPHNSPQWARLYHPQMFRIRASRRPLPSGTPGLSRRFLVTCLPTPA
jgi:hypothetical protein